MVLYTTTETLGDGPDRVDLISFRGKELVLKVTDPNYFSLKNPNEILGAEVLHPCIVHVESLLPRSLHSPNKGLGICTNYQGPNLRTWLARATYVAIEKQLELIWQLWQVVAELHRLHIIHLDLKPENVVISEADDDLPKLIDFGHARKLAPEADLCFKSSCNYMTITYAPPEAISHTEKTYGAHSDIWSLAAIAYFVLSEGDDLLPDVSPKRRAQLSTPAKCHAHLAKALPKEVAPIIPLLVKMLSATPSTRPSLAQALDDPCWTKLAKFNRGSAPTATLLQPKRYYISDPSAWSQIQPHIGSIVACYARLLASSPARSLYLACDIFYRAAYLGWHPDRPGRSARIWRQLAFISIYLAEASRDILHHRDIEILADHFGLDGHLTDATPSWLADAVVAKALVGIVQPSWLYDTLASKQQVSLGVNRWLLDPETYLGWDQKRTAPIIPSKPPYTGDVASLKIFWQDI